jgi:hypothetical protein
MSMGAWACRSSSGEVPTPVAPVEPVDDRVPTSPSADVGPEPSAVHPPDETDPPDPPAPAGEPIEASGTLLPEPIEYPAARASEATCERLSDAALARMEHLAAPCETADDCIVVDSVCPFGCFQVVSARAKLGPVRAAVARYFQRCTPCKNSCMAPPPQLACDEGRCVDPRLPPTR